ncbi:unnamed protein product [Chondrus crispus]|uniref:Uncharacterized protein n=1 Tax=Chondrus crispus TaxID=2769 RepID=R7Q8C5_CHOCR|nr:unnamed protein product [Chondrus crispus]CDF33735.1 unnamed protein product [Chondrus crispus]|eukprot:XP_005713554.1 unnamed protein product [Chondrus crispus]
MKANKCCNVSLLDSAPPRLFAKSHASRASFARISNISSSSLSQMLCKCCSIFELASWLCRFHSTWAFAITSWRRSPSSTIGSRLQDGRVPGGIMAVMSRRSPSSDDRFLFLSIASAIAATKLSKVSFS